MNHHPHNPAMMTRRVAAAAVGQQQQQRRRPSPTAACPMEAAEKGFRQQQQQQPQITPLTSNAATTTTTTTKFPGGTRRVRRRQRTTFSSSSRRVWDALWSSIIMENNNNNNNAKATVQQQQQRKLSRYLRRNPERVYAMVGLVVGTMLVLCWVLSAVLGSRQQPQPQQWMMTAAVPSAKVGSSIDGFVHDHNNNNNYKNDHNNKNHDNHDRRESPTQQQQQQRQRFGRDHHQRLDMGSDWKKKEQDPIKQQQQQQQQQQRLKKKEKLPLMDKEQRKKKAEYTTTVPHNNNNNDRHHHPRGGDAKASSRPELATTSKGSSSIISTLPPQSQTSSFAIVFASAAASDDAAAAATSSSITTASQPHHNTTTTTTHNYYWTLPDMSQEELTEGEYPDYGDIHLHVIKPEEDFRRQIYDDDDDDWRMKDEDHSLRPDDTEIDYAFDDDRLRVEALEETIGNSSKGEEEEVVVVDPQTHCRRIHDHRVNHPNCNTFHETQWLDNHVQYLSEGAYRQVLVLDHFFEQKDEKVIMKDIQYDYDFDVEHFEYVRMDAMVAERLSASPRIYDIFGFCGLGIVSEFFSNGDVETIAIRGKGHPDEDHDTKPLKSYNPLTGDQKLALSLQMAEAVADLHGFPGGVIVHQDIQLSQFLFNNAATRVILNDFNRAEFMLWDGENKKYCKYTEGKGHGDWRSPEEFYDKPLTEKVDVYSLCNNMYSVLTGLWVFYDSENSDVTQKRVMTGEKPFIDPRYKDGDPAEAKLAEILPRCYEYSPDKRPSVFQLVGWLREARTEVRKQHSS